MVVDVVVAALVCLVVCIGAALAMGRDLNWDYFNYHAYSAMQWRSDRLAQDFFAAGLQGYLNPLAFAPLGMMQALGLHSALIATVLAGIQSLNLLFLYLINRHLFADVERPRLAAVVITVLGGATVAFWSQVGSTFVDATISPLIMASLWLVLRHPSRRGLAASMLMAGAAVALKWTLIPYVMGLWVAVALLPGSSRQRLLRQISASTSMLAGFLLCYGYWGWRLYQEFGSPLFPLFNSFFKAPDFPAISNTFLRFVPETWVALLQFPLRMAENESWIYTEVAAPDLRPTLVLALVVAGLALSLMRALRPQQLAGAARDSAIFAADQGSWPVLLVFFGVSLALWLKTSANGRYAVPTLILLGPILWGLAVRILGVRVGRTAIVLVSCLQVLHMASAGVPRWNKQPWTHEMLPASVPAALSSKPYLFVSVGRSSESHVAARVHPESPFINALGMYAIENEGPGWQRFTAMRSRWAGRTQVLFKMPADASDPSTPMLIEAIDEKVDRLGLTLNHNDCHLLVFNSMSEETGDDPLQERRHRRNLLSCPASLKERPDAELANQRKLAQRIADALELRCPQFFQPARPQIEGSRGMWTRHYLQYDLFVTVAINDDSISFRQERQATPVVLGRVSTWHDDVQRFRCRLPHGGARSVETLRGEHEGR